MSFFKKGRYIGPNVFCCHRVVEIYPKFWKLNDIYELPKENKIIFSLLSNEMENAIDKPGNPVDDFPTCTRFVSMNCDIERAIEKMTPEATRKKTEWVVRVFRDWHKWKNDQNILSEAELSVFDDMDEMSKGDLNFLLQKFVFEVRKKNNESYPPKTLYLDHFGSLRILDHSQARVAISAFLVLSPFSAQRPSKYPLLSESWLLWSELVSLHWNFSFAASKGHRNRSSRVSCVP